MSDHKKRILEMLADKKVTVDEAVRLLEATEQPADSEAKAEDKAETLKGKYKYLRVMVSPGEEGEQGGKAERVNIRVPMSLLYAGIKLAAFMPSDATGHVNDALREKGINVDVSNIKAEELEPLIDALSDLEVDVEDGKEKVRVYVE